MLWIAAFRIFRTIQVIQKDKFLIEELGALSEKTKKAITAKKIGTSADVAKLVRKDINSTIKWKTRQIEKSLEDTSIIRTTKRFVANRALNHYGHKFFGELWYYGRYGLKENFFWDHPFLDALLHPKDKEKWSFLAQFCTIYKLPPFLRYGIRMFLLKDRSKTKMAALERIYDLIDRDIEGSIRYRTLQEHRRLVTERNRVLEQPWEQLLHEQEKLMKWRQRKAKTLQMNFDYEFCLDLIRGVDWFGLDMACQQIVKYLSLYDEKDLIRLTNRFFNYYRRLGYSAMKIRAGVLVSYLGINTSITFSPSSPETGNFFLCQIKLRPHKVRIWINNVWYKKHAFYYDFDASYEIMAQLISSRNFGKVYHRVLKHRKVKAPHNRYKKWNFNGTHS